MASTIAASSAATPAPASTSSARRRRFSSKARSTASGAATTRPRLSLRSIEATTTIPAQNGEPRAHAQSATGASASAGTIVAPGTYHDAVRASGYTVAPATIASVPARSVRSARAIPSAATASHTTSRTKGPRTPPIQSAAA